MSSYHIILKKPLVGVFMRASSIKDFRNQQPLPRLVGLQEANEKVNLTLYFFSLNDVNMRKKTITGTYYNKAKGLWETQQFPYPNIIYKRHASSKRKRDETNLFQEQLRKLNVKPLNFLQGFNKWEVYQHLSTDEKVLPHLPTTKLYNNPQDLKEMFEHADNLYLKACRSGRGRHVLKVTKLPDGEYQLSSYIHHLSVTKFKNFDSLIAMITDFYGTKNFIIQEAIDLITIGESIVDMRPELQKNAKGKIVLAGIPVRIGNVNAPITTHATSYNFETFFKDFMGYSDLEIAALKNRIFDFLKITYQSLEKFYGQSGEVGIDIGLDKKGQLWFIECNSQSRKVSFFNAYDQATIDKSFVNLLKYSKFLYKKIRKKQKNKNA